MGDALDDVLLLANPLSPCCGSCRLFIGHSCFLSSSLPPKWTFRDSARLRPPVSPEAAALLLRLLLSGDGALGPFTRARIGLGALPAHRQAAPVTQTPIAADLHQTAYAQLVLAPQIAFHPVIALQDLAHPGRLRFGHIAHARIRVDARRRHDFLGAGQTDAIDIGKRVFDSLVAWQIHARNTCQTESSFDASARRQPASSALPGRAA